MATARIDESNWFRCAQCGHKLGRIAGAWDKSIKAFPAIETKCHSCGQINYLLVGGQAEVYKNKGASINTDKEDVT